MVGQRRSLLPSWCSPVDRRSKASRHQRQADHHRGRPLHPRRKNTQPVKSTRARLDCRCPRQAFLSVVFRDEVAGMVPLFTLNPFSLGEVGMLFSTRKVRPRPQAEGMISYLSRDRCGHGTGIARTCRRHHQSDLGNHHHHHVQSRRIDEHPQTILCPADWLDVHFPRHLQHKSIYDQNYGTIFGTAIDLGLYSYQGIIGADFLALTLMGADALNVLLVMALHTEGHRSRQRMERRYSFGDCAVLYSGATVNVHWWVQVCRCRTCLGRCRRNVDAHLHSWHRVGTPPTMSATGRYRKRVPSCLSSGWDGRWYGGFLRSPS